MDIGSVLYEARSRHGLTLEQIAQATKVPATVLDHIEHNRFERLPGPVFAKGYLRAFAASVGADGEELVQEYKLRSAPSSPASVPSRQATSELPLRNARRIGMAVLGLLVALAAAVYLAPSPRSASNATAVAIPPMPVATSGAVAPAAEPPVTWPMRIEMMVSADCWVSATVDGESAVYRLLRRGEQVSVTANTEVLLRVGDPTVFTYRLNGAPGLPVGRPGAPATIRINRETYQDFIERAAHAPVMPGAN